MTKLEKLYLFSVVFTDSVMTDWAMVELLGDTRTISKETGSVSTEVQEMVLLPPKSSLAPCWGSVIVMAEGDSELAVHTLILALYRVEVV